ncbi:hypothetical protein AB0R12_21120, partial [Streptomyces niveus]
VLVNEASLRIGTTLDLARSAQELTAVALPLLAAALLVPAWRGRGRAAAVVAGVAAGAAPWVVEA